MICCARFGESYRKLLTGLIVASIVKIIFNYGNGPDYFAA
jgi:hypothetical protein